MRKRALLTIAVVASLTLASCHKTCSCYRYDGVIISYTSDEVSERGGSCSDLRYQSNTTLYSYCEWDY